MSRCTASGSVTVEYSESGASSAWPPGLRVPRREGHVKSQLSRLLLVS